MCFSLCTQPTEKKTKKNYNVNTNLTLDDTDRTTTDIIYA